MVHSSSDCDDEESGVVLINARRSKNEPVCGEVMVQGGSPGAGWAMEGGGPSSGMRGEREDVRAMGRRSRAVRRAKKGPPGAMIMAVIVDI